MHEVQSTVELSEVRSLLSLDLPILGDLHFYITNIGLLLILGACLIFTLKILRVNIKPLNTNYNKFIGNILFKSKEYSYAATLHNIIVNFIRMVVYIFTNRNRKNILFVFFLGVFIVILRIYPSIILDGLHYSVSNLIYSGPVTESTNYISSGIIPNGIRSYSTISTNQSHNSARLYNSLYSNRDILNKDEKLDP